MSEADRFLRDPEVGHITGLSRTTRWRLEKAGKFPRRRKISPNVSANLESEIFAWVKEKAAQADAAAA